MASITSRENPFGPMVNCDVSRRDGVGKENLPFFGYPSAQDSEMQDLLALPKNKPVDDVESGGEKSSVQSPQSKTSLNIYPLIGRVKNWSILLKDCIFETGLGKKNLQSAFYRKVLSKGLSKGVNTFLSGVDGWKRSALLGALGGGVVTAALIMILFGPQSCIGLGSLGIIFGAMVKGGLAVGILGGASQALIKKKLSDGTLLAVGSLAGLTSLLGVTTIGLLTLVYYGFSHGWIHIGRKS